MTDQTSEPTLFGFPLNRIVAFLGPHIAWLAGVFATWLVVHLHFLATFHVGQSALAKVIAQVVVFGVVTLVTWLGHQKWLEGYQRWAYGALPAAVDPGATWDTTEAATVPAEVENFEATDPAQVPPDEGNEKAERKGGAR